MGTIARYLVPIDSKLSAAEYADKAMEELEELIKVGFNED